MRLVLATILLAAPAHTATWTSNNGLPQGALDVQATIAPTGTLAIITQPDGTRLATVTGTGGEPRAYVMVPVERGETVIVEQRTGPKERTMYAERVR